MDVNEGEAYVAGLNTETAKRLLDAAEKAGLDPQVVRTAPGGFVVPADLVDKPKARRTTKKTETDQVEDQSTTDKK